MSFENDIFISYAHIDDLALVEGQKGWVSSFHRALEIRLAQLLGRPPSHVARSQAPGNDVFADRLVERLPRWRSWCACCSPRYVQVGLVHARAHRVRQGDRGARAACASATRRASSRCVKTPVPLGQQPEDFQGLLGYEFFRSTPRSAARAS